MIPIGYLVLAFSVPAQYLAQVTGQHLGCAGWAQYLAQATGQHLGCAGWAQYLAQHLGCAGWAQYLAQATGQHLGCASWAQHLAQATGQHLALRLQFDGSDRAQPFSLVDHVLALAAQHKCH